MKTKIDAELLSIIRRIVSTESIEDINKENLRRRAREAMEIYSRRRAFFSVLRVELIISGVVIIMAIIFGAMGQPPAAWVTPLTIGVVASLVFGILSGVFQSRYRARATNLQSELSALERKGGKEVYPIVPFVCVIGPYVDSYRGFSVQVRSEKDGSIQLGYSNLGLIFLESVEGGDFVFTLKKASGALHIDSNECGIITATLVKKTIVFSKQEIKIPESAFAIKTAEVSEPTREESRVISSSPSIKPQTVAPIDKTPNELIEDSPFDQSANSISVSSGRICFFVYKNEVCDMLKCGDYPMDINSFPRLKAMDPIAFEKNNPSLRILTLNTERVYRIGWKLDGSIFAKGDIEFKITNPRLFVNIVIEDRLFYKVDFENEVLRLIRPMIQNHLLNETAKDYDVIEVNLLKNLKGGLDKIGLSLEFVGLNALSKEENTSYCACIHCGKVIPADATFCPYCGKKQQDNICPSCGAEIPDGALFCPKCGAKK